MLRVENRFIFFIALLLLGTLMAVQGKSIFKLNTQKTTAAKQITEYKKALLSEQDKEKSLKKKITENEKTKDQLLKDMTLSEKDSTINQLAKELEKLKLIAGLTDVKGKGVIITMNDSPEQLSEDPSDSIIHQTSVYTVVNELKYAGAQAIAINGERLLPTSEQVCAGPTIRINKNRYPVPYVITAIGDADLLYDGVNESGIAIGLRSNGIQVEVSKSDNITIPKYHEKIDNLITGLEVLNQ